jgi:hypothetical protein
VAYVQALGAQEPNGGWGWAYRSGPASKVLEIPWNGVEPNQYREWNEDCAVISDQTGRMEDYTCTAEPTYPRTIACRGI